MTAHLVQEVIGGEVPCGAQGRGDSQHSEVADGVKVVLVSQEDARELALLPARVPLRRDVDLEPLAGVRNVVGGPWILPEHIRCNVFAIQV